MIEAGLLIYQKTELSIARKPMPARLKSKVGWKTLERFMERKLVDTDFWRTVPLSAMTKEQWDRVCDGCGKCCLLKYRETSSGQVYDSNIACNLLNVQTCRCTNYGARLQVNPECIAMTLTELDQNASQWPETCSYRRLYEGKELPTWHYLVSGSSEAVHDQPDAVTKVAVNERNVQDFRAHLRAKIMAEVDCDLLGPKRD